jgi:hypothetical protein
VIKYFNNQDFLKREAKDKLNLQEQGENVVIVPEGQLNLEAAVGQSVASTTNTLDQSQSAGAQKNIDSNPMRWWKYLFGR